jgi:divalent metal cation (Fe/Co/Zn/Cd) transporter
MTSKSSPLRFAVLLVAVTLAYNVFEGAVAVAAGFRAQSLTLTAFGADSYVEVLAAAAVLWRMSFQDEEEGERAEARALRFIGASFLVLAAGVTFEAVVGLTQGHSADKSMVGIIVLALSLVLMPALSLAKLSYAARTGMAVLAAEAKETVACSWLSFTALIGLIAIATLDWSWLDSAAALMMVPWLVKEGMEGLRGDNCSEGVSLCFCSKCLFGLRNCRAECCVTA